MFGALIEPPSPRPGPKLNGGALVALTLASVRNERSRVQFPLVPLRYAHLPCNGKRADLLSEIQQNSCGCNPAVQLQPVPVMTTLMYGYDIVLQGRVIHIEPGHMVEFAGRNASPLECPQARRGGESGF